MNRRREIRRRLEDVLKGKTAAGERININPGSLSQPFPYLEIVTPEELSELASSSSRMLENNLSVTVRSIVRATSKGQALNELDDLTSVVETCLGENEQLGGLAQELILKRTLMDFDDSGDSVLGFASQEFSCTYLTSAHRIPSGSVVRKITMNFRSGDGV